MSSTDPFLPVCPYDARVPSFPPASFLFCLLDAYLDIPLRCYDRERELPPSFFALRLLFILPCQL
jgi:hypothetical protein